jgi:hypothetical protein
VQARLVSREIRVDRGADAVRGAEGNIAVGAKRESTAGPARSGEPEHVRNLHARDPGEPRIAHPADHRVGRSGKAKAVRLR